MHDQRRRTVLKGGFGIGAAAMLPACVGARARTELGAATTRVDNIAALRALPPAATPAVEMAGFHRPADGGGGVFYWASDDTTPDDCGLIVAPDDAGTGRWRRDAEGGLAFAWFGPRGDGDSDDAPALRLAIDCALRTGLPLHLGPGTYLLASDVKAEIGEGQSLSLLGEGATLLRRGSSGTLYLDSEPVALLPVVDAILPGGDGLTVAGAGEARVGDLVEVHTGLRLSQEASTWVATEYARIAAIRGSRLVLDRPTNSRVQPNRRLIYRMDGITDRLHYRLFWAAERADELRVSLDGRPLTLQADYTATGSVTSGFDIVFARPPAAGSEVVLETIEPIYAKISRGGQLSVSGLRFESDFPSAGPVTFLSSQGLAPAGSRFSDLDLIERNAPLGEAGYRQGLEGDLFRVGLIDSTVERLRIEGGRYAVMAIKGRNATYRDIVGEGCWHVISSVGAHSNNIVDVTAIRCYAAVDSHYAASQYVDGVVGVACRDGMNHRANGGFVRNAVMVDNTSPDINGLNFGVSQGGPADDHLLADPLDNPVAMFSDAISGARNDIEISDCRFGAPNDSHGFGFYGSWLRRLTIRNVTIDGSLVINGDGPPPLRELIMDRFAAKSLTLRGVTDMVQAKQVRSGALHLSGAEAPLMRFEDCVFDGAIDGSGTLIYDGGGSGSLECRFVNCIFRNAARLIGPDDAGTIARHFVFQNCTFEVGDTSGYG